MIPTYCFLYCEELVAKTVPDNLKKVQDTLVKMVNFIKLQLLNLRLFQILCKVMNTEHKSLLLHTEVCWLSCGKVLHCIYQLREIIKFISANKLKSTPGLVMKFGG